MHSQEPCFLCNADSAQSLDEAADTLRVECKTCGVYEIVGPLAKQCWENVGGFPKINRPYLVSGTAREALEKFKRDPRLRNVPCISSGDDLRRIVSEAPRDVHSRARKLLAAIDRKSSEFGEFVKLIPAVDRPLGYAASVKEFVHLLHLLEEQKWIELLGTMDVQTVKLNWRGIDELQSRALEIEGLTEAFVAMWFDDSVKPAFTEAIGPAVSAAGWKPIRVDFTNYNGDVVDEVLARIRRSRFLIADLTAHRGGVYFEAGFAFGLGRDVIFTCRKDAIKDLHFDLRNYNFIAWTADALDAFGDRLRNRIEATIGIGPVDPR
jgi:hypothetical protein